MRRYNPYYNPKLLRYCLVMFAVMLVAMRVTNGWGFAVIIPFALLALTRNRPALFLFYVMLSISAVVLNTAITPKGATFFIEQRAMMGAFGFLLATKVAGQRNSPLVKPFLLLVFYLFYMVIPSLQGWVPVVSIMKLLLFGVIYLAFYGAANLAATSSRSGIRDVRSVVLAIVCPFVIGSVLLIPFPAISMMGAEELLANPNVQSLFKGMTSHSQCLGPIVACIGTIVFSDLMFGIRKPDKLYIVILFCCPLLVWKTSSRTAMGAMLAGMAFVMFFFVNARGISSGWKRKVMNAVLGAFVVLVIAVLCAGGTEKIKKFIVKRGYTEGGMVNTEKVIGGRMAMSDRQFANFRKKPLMGNGFQVSEELADRLTGPWYTMLSAPIEKGVWVSAILEEGGAFGMAIFLTFVVVTLSTLIRRRAYTGASALFVFLISNLGEFTMFSMSYAGGFVWSLIFAALALDSARSREQRHMQMMPVPNGMWLGYYR